MLGAMLCRNEEQHEKMMRDRERKEAEQSAKVRIIKERGVMLRAKLLHIRDSIDADHLLADAMK
jgi:hypothetical protein